MRFAEPIARLVHELERLPGIGTKTAQRLAFHLLTRPPEDVRRLAESMTHARDMVKYCGECCNLTDMDPCRICTDPRRDHTVICVVEHPRDVLAMEKTREFTGTYHVLHGVLSPMDGIGPDQIRIGELLQRVPAGVTELIVATNPDVEGEATALYLSRLIAPLGVRVTRLARGLPVGGDLEYADEVTLSKAIEGRREI